MIEKIITLRCVAEDSEDFKYFPKNFFVSNEVIEPDDLGDLLCNILNDKPLDDSNFVVEVVDEPAEDKIVVPGDEPGYYSSNGLSPLQAFRKGLISLEEYEGFIKGNVIKYTVRVGKKDDAIKDIDKAIDYLSHLRELYEEAR